MGETVVLHLVEDEWWPVLDDAEGGLEVAVPIELAKAYKAAREEFQRVQEELLPLYRAAGGGDRYDMVQDPKTGGWTLVRREPRTQQGRDNTEVR